MCGIAGYNIDPDWAAANLDSDKMENILATSWMYNLHRGTDAAGFFLETLEPDKNDKSLMFYKRGDSAEVILKDDNLSTLPVARVFGAHTRASTMGMASVNGNNHPVNHGNVWVTHNGHISNHDELRRHLKAGSHPIVDSQAIAVVLDECGDPWNPQNVTDALKKLQGGYAIHAVWDDIPGLSLIARGSNSPLIVRWNPNVGVFYSSEKDASYTILSDLELEPNNTEEWNVNDMEEFTAFLFYNGQPIWWTSWVPEMKPGSVNVRGPVTYSRLTPEGEVIYSTDWVKDFASFPAPRSFDEITGEPELMLEGGELRGKETNRNKPFYSDSWIGTRAYEADYVYKFGQRHFIFLNDVQIITDGDGKIYDIVDMKRSQENRWLSEDTRHRGVEAETFEEFLDEYGRYIKDDQVKQAPRYKASVVVPFKGAYSEQTWGIDWDEDDMPERAMFQEDLERGEIVTQANFGVLWRHRHNETFRFRKNRQCKEHNQGYQHHIAPTACEEVKAAALEVMACFEHIDFFTATDPTLKITFKMTEGVCNGPCKMEVRYFVNVRVGDEVFALPIGEECDVCSSTRFLNEFPKWVETLRPSQLDLVEKE